MKANQKHLTLSDRILIELGLNQGFSFKDIASKIDKDLSTVSKEIRKPRTKKQHKRATFLPGCIHEKFCGITGLCEHCYRNCNECSKCRSISKNYVPKTCGRLIKPPYVSSTSTFLQIHGRP